MIVLTGGSGFIGSCFLWKLNKEGITDILVVDDLGNNDKWKNLSGKKFTDYVQKNDFLELIENNKIPKPKAVVHMGACSSTTVTDGDYFIQNNYEYSKKLALWAFKNKARFIYASSAATYGDGAFGYKDDVEIINKLKPLNMYGFSKQLFDLWMINKGLNKKGVGLKFFNVFGPNEYHKGEMRSVVCKKFPKVKDKGFISLFKSYWRDYKDGEQRRDFVYVKDAVEVMFYFLSNSDKNGIYNLGTGQSRTWNDLANAMFKALDKKPNIKYIEMPDYLRPKYQYYTEADITKLRNAGCDLQFQDLETSIADYLTYLKQNTYL